MKFTVDTKIFDKWPEVIIGVLVLTNIDNAGKNEEILKLLRNQENETQQSLASVEIGSLPEVITWRQIHREFGSNHRDFPSSIESLLRRARGGKPLPEINKLVDLYNFLSVKYRVPAGAEDIDKIKGGVSLTFATGSENGKYLGSEVIENCTAGEVIYKDDEGFICRRWNWREAERTMIEDTTKNALLVFEAAPPVGIEKLNSVLEEAQNLAQQFLRGNQQKFILEKNKPQIDF